jgi:proteic killer suppression protein
MIIHFKHRGLELFYIKGSLKGIPAQFASRIERILDRLDAAQVPNDMDLPGYKFHELRGSRKGVFTVSVSSNWRLSFEFKDSDVVNVDMEDYH